MIRHSVDLGQYPYSTSVEAHEDLHWVVGCVILGDIVYLSTLYILMTF